MPTLLALTLLAPLLAQQAEPLAEGSGAPPVAGVTWVKGEAVAEFVKGKVYVLEFWSTWSGPCLESLPRFNALANKFKDKATFVGVNVWDRDVDPKSTEYVGRIQDWVVAQGTAMSFKVCVDDTSDTMMRSWLQAAAQTSIPTVFVVDRAGKVAWIGKGMAGLEEVVSKVATGTLGTEAAKTLHKELDERQRQVEALYSEARRLMSEKKADAALARLAEVAKLDSSTAEFLPLMKFDMLCESDEAAAVAYLGKAIDGEIKDNAPVLQKIGTGIAMGFVPMQSPDYALALRALSRALEIAGKDVPDVLMAMAEATYRTDKKSEAVELMERACKALEREPLTSIKQREAFEKRLEQYKAGGD